jgi:hypothetical protein
MKKLLEALEKESKDIKTAHLFMDGDMHDIYYRTMSGDDHARAMDLSKRTKTVKEADGSTTELSYYDDDLLRCHIIYFQLLNEKGERVFNNITKVKWIRENIAYETSAYLASVMGLKSVGAIVEEQTEAIKKMIG